MSDLLGPQQTVIITSRAEINLFGKEITKDDLETIFWHMPLSKDELIYSIAVPNSKHIIRLIEKSLVFAVNFLPYGSEKKAHECNLLHGEHIDKFEKLGFTKKEAESVDCPVIDEACAILECNVIETKKYKDHTFYIAKIIKSDVKSRSRRLFHLRNNDYTTTKDI